jgi:phosphoglycerate dehydrogenase-like enzyme
VSGEPERQSGVVVEMVSRRRGSVCVGLLFPTNIDVAEMRRLVPDVQLDVRTIGYLDPPDVHYGKADGEPEIELRKREPALSERQRADLADAEVLLAVDLPFDIPLLAPRVEWVQGFGAGVRPLLRVLADSDVVVTTASGIAGPAIAEFVIARLLQVWRDLRRIDALQLDRRWLQQGSMPAAGRTILVVGLGGIGRELARRAHALDLRVIATRRDVEADVPTGVDEVFGPDAFTSLLPRADAVVLTPPLTRETVGMVGSPELAAMRRGAVLCNVSRGRLVDESALLAALESGHLGAAILDVAVQEPLPATSPLWTAPNMYLSSHSSAAIATYTDDLVLLFAENLRRYCAGQPLLNLADPVRGY